MKAKQALLFSVFYFILVIAVISVKLIGQDDLENFLKPLLMLTLMLWYAVDSKTCTVKMSWLFMFALFFSFLGDVFLMPFFDIFILGLVFFLISHILYIWVFFSGSSKGIWTTLKQSPIFLIGVLSAYFGLLLILMPKVYLLDSLVLMIAIPIYASVLLLMVLSTFTYSRAYFYNYGKLVMLGGLLFLVSDGILAINKFAIEVPYDPIWVMGNYTLAQWMLVYGYIKSQKKA